MPILRLDTTVTLSKESEQALLAALSRIVAEVIGKPESYVMVVVQPAAIQMSGSRDEAAFVDVRSIGGLSNGVNRKLSKRICAELGTTLGLKPERIYLNFTNVQATDWGWKGSTFG